MYGALEFFFFIVVFSFSRCASGESPAIHSIIMEKKAPVVDPRVVDKVYGINNTIGIFIEKR